MLDDSGDILNSEMHGLVETIQIVVMMKCMVVDGDNEVMAAVMVKY